VKEKKYNIYYIVEYNTTFRRSSLIGTESTI